MSGSITNCHSVLNLAVFAMLFGLSACVKDLDLDRRQIVIRRGRGQKDRLTVLPTAAIGPLERHPEAVKRQHQDDLVRGLGRVVLPFALDRKYSNAPTEWAWQVVVVLMALVVSVCPDATTAAQRPEGPESQWQQAMAALHYPGTELEKSNSRPPKATADAMMAIAKALDPEYPPKQIAQDLFLFVPRYDPIWLGPEINKTTLDAMAGRLQVMKSRKDEVARWQTALAKAHGGGVDVLWTFGIVTGIPRLFTASGVHTVESGKLLERLENVPPDAVSSLATTVKIAKARAAGSLIDQDWLWPKETFDAARFRAALEGVTRAISSK